jgi:hypothetical protein
MSIGAFSVSLAAKDIYIIKNFYEKLGFKEFVGNIAGKWSIMKNLEFNPIKNVSIDDRLPRKTRRDLLEQSPLGPGIDR